MEEGFQTHSHTPPRPLLIYDYFGQLWSCELTEKGEGKMVFFVVWCLVFGTKTDSHQIRETELSSTDL